MNKRKKNISAINSKIEGVLTRGSKSNSLSNCDKLSSKYKNKIGKRILEVISSVAIILLIITGSKFAGLSVPINQNSDIKNYDTSLYTSIGESVNATFTSSSGLVTISGSGTIDKTKWNTFVEENGKDNIKTITIANSGIYLPEDSSGFFYQFTNLTSINNATNLDTSKVTTMENMFNYCILLETIDVSNWDTSNVTNMIRMFKSCEALKTVDVSNWNTSNLTDILNMFIYCKSLETIDVSKWDTKKVTNINNLFRECALKTLDLSNWDMSNVTSVTDFLTGCYSLQSIKTPKVYSAQTITLPAKSADTEARWYNVTNTSDNTVYSSFTQGTFTGSVELSRILIEPAYIKGTILTENHEGKHTVAITLYKLDETVEEDIPILEKNTNEDGNYSIEIQELGIYKLVIQKQGYLKHIITNIQIEELGKAINLGTYNLIAGDVAVDGEIELDDLVKLNDNYKQTVTEENKIYDLNEDGQINNEDRQIILKNFGKVQQTQRWQNTQLKAQQISSILTKQNTFLKKYRQ